jgi:3-oxoacyl-[acyl-carrier-protein] synthase II
VGSDGKLFRFSIFLLPEHKLARRRVVITGLGILSPVGNSVETAWQNIIAGRSGIDRITRFDVSSFPVQIAGEVRDFDIGQYLSAKEARRMDVFIHYGMAAGIQAIRDAGLEAHPAQAERVGVSIGSGIGGLPMIENTCDDFAAGGVRKVSPFFVPGSIINMISGNLSIMYGYKGPNISLVSACSTGTHSIGDAGRLIEYGDADVMIAGGAEGCLSNLGLGGFCAPRALSTRNDDPQTASRPWDRDRDGFVLSEGAGVVVLEEYEHAKARGARIYCELAGFGMSADANHITAPCDDGEGAARCMDNALRNAQLNPEDVQYVNAHGTSTPLGDKAETIAVKRAFGAHASKLVVNSTKSMTGHLLGAAGGVEALFSALAVYHQISPPTINLFNPDEGCDLDYCANEARQLKIDVAISNSFGFGGTNATVVLKRI